MTPRALLRVAVAAFCWLAACGGSEQPAAAAGDPSSEWLDFGALSLDDQGQTTELLVPWQAGQQRLLLEVSSPALRCFQVDELKDDAGHAYVDRAESGPYCVGCEQRSEVAAGGGLFVYPSRSGAFVPAGAMRIRMGLRDCDTLTRGTPDARAQTLSVRARGTGPAPERGTIALQLIVTPASSLHSPASDAALDSILQALNAQLAPAQLAARWAQVIRLPLGAASDAAFSRADPSALQQLLSQGSAGSAATAAAGIPVVLAGCLRLSEPVLGVTSEPQGYTPHIPGGAGPADGIFIQGTLCATPGPVRVEWSPSALARVLAHELGHYLGLYHTVEADGSSDQLEDTGAANSMFHRPGLASAEGLSAMQGAVMRSHPAVVPAR